jgi:hypothetical protein
MSKELPAGLRPVPVPTDTAAAAAEAIAGLRGAVANDHAWLVATVTPDGEAASYGSSSVEDSKILALSALQAWADSAKLQGQQGPSKVFQMVMEVTGTRSEYISGGTVERRA